MVRTSFPVSHHYIRMPYLSTLQTYTWIFFVFMAVALVCVIMIHIRVKIIGGEWKDSCGGCVRCMSWCTGWCQDKSACLCAWRWRRRGYAVQVCLGNGINTRHSVAHVLVLQLQRRTTWSWRNAKCIVIRLHIRQPENHRPRTRWWFSRATSPHIQTGESVPPTLNNFTSGLDPLP